MEESTFNRLLGELLEARRPKTWKDVVPECACSEENEFCQACIKWYVDVTY